MEFQHGAVRRESAETTPTESSQLRPVAKTDKGKATDGGGGDVLKRRVGENPAECIAILVGAESADGMRGQGRRHGHRGISFISTVISAWCKK